MNLLNLLQRTVQIQQILLFLPYQSKYVWHVQPSIAQSYFLSDEPLANHTQGVSRQRLELQVKLISLLALDSREG